MVHFGIDERGSPSVEVIWAILMFFWGLNDVKRGFWLQMLLVL